MKQKWFWSDWAVEQGALAANITDEVQKVLDRYVENNDVKILEEIMDERPAHVIDVIYRESIRTYNEDNPYQMDGKSVLYEDGKSFFTCFHTRYDQFDKDKVFWVNDDERVDEHSGFWSFPISVWKKDSESAKYDDRDQCSNFTTHNYFYPQKKFTYINDNCLFTNFYQDIDIMGSEDGWYKDLIKALYRVVLAVYLYWEKHVKLNKGLDEMSEPSESGLREIFSDDYDNIFDNDYDTD